MADIEYLESTGTQWIDTCTPLFVNGMETVCDVVLTAIGSGTIIGIK